MGTAFSDKENNPPESEKSSAPSRQVRIMMAVALAVFTISILHSSKVFDRLFAMLHEETEEIAVLPENTGIEADEVFMVSEVMPKLIGGLESIQRAVHYPEIAKKAGVEGKVFLQFIVDKDGRVIEPVVTRGVGAGCDEAALEALRTARFIPGRQRGKAVSVKMSLPVTFKLR